MWEAYPLRDPPGLEAPEPTSPAMRRVEVERRRLEARGRAALMRAVRNMVVFGDWNWGREESCLYRWGGGRVRWSDGEQTNHCRLGMAFDGELRSPCVIDVTRDISCTKGSIYMLEMCRQYIIIIKNLDGSNYM